MCGALIFYQNVFIAVFVVDATAAVAAIAFVVVFFIGKVFLSYDSLGQSVLQLHAVASVQISFGTACTPVRMRNAILN